MEEPLDEAEEAAKERERQDREKHVYNKTCTKIGKVNIIRENEIRDQEGMNEIFHTT